MAEVVASSLLRLVFDKLGNKILKEFGMSRGVDKELKKLESTLSTIHDVLEDAEARQVKEKALRGWLRKLKDVAYDVDDVLDEVAAKAMKRRSENKSHITEKVRQLSSIPDSFVFPSKIAHKIKKIRERLEEIAGERTKFHLQERVAENIRAETTVREETGSLIDESEVYGRQEDKEKIIDFLINMSDERDLGVTAIVGLGGLGKTTVAQLVYNDPRVCEHFGKMIWVYVSDDFDIKRLTRSIIETMSGSECSLTGMDLMQHKLKELIGDKRFLLVLDDVWNENYEKWDRLRTVLIGSARGSKVIVTTRSARVASIMGTVAPHFLSDLSEEDCWLLFEKRAFGLGGCEKTPYLVAIGKEIVKKCGGVPLAAKALGSLMRFRRGESQWLAIKESEIWNLPDDENEILPALMLSYNHLPSHLKQCFAYCSIFPKGEEIRSEQLVQLWIAEGFVQSSNGGTYLEDVGLLYVDELLSRSLFQRGQEDLDGVVRQVKMHDLVHDLARSIAGDECSIADAGDETVTSQNCRYASLICRGPITTILEPLKDAQRLRTLYFIASRGRTEEEDKGDDVLQAIFSKMKLLRALHLSKCPMKALPVSVAKLKHLRYLSLSYTDIETLPPCIGALQNLQIFDLSCCRQLRAMPETIGDLQNLLCLNLSDCKNIFSLPNSIGYARNLQNLDLSFSQIQTLPESLSFLSNLQSLSLRYCYFLNRLPENMKNVRSLKHLDIYQCCELACMPPGMGQLTHLRTLPMFVLGGKNSCRLSELGRLNLLGELDIRGLENVGEATEARKANLKEKQGLQSLKLSWDLNAYVQPGQPWEEIENEGTSMKELVAQDWDADADLVEEVLGNLQPHKNLKVLKITEYAGKTLPWWLKESSLPYLAELSLTSCVRCVHLSGLEQLHTLRVLKLIKLPAVKCLPAVGQLPYLEVLVMEVLAVRCLGSEFYGGEGAFPALEEFKLSCMLDLEDWPTVGGGEFLPHLSKLCIVECPKLRALPSAFPSVRELNMNIDDELLLSSFESGAFPNLKILNIGNCDFDNDNDDNEDDDHDNGDNIYPSFIPKVLAVRMSSLEHWFVRAKPKPIASGSSTMVHLQCVSMNVVFAGETLIMPLL
ncbi:putative disease resistance protein RGA3 [Elaeis guineensis]|uniref:Disease resistance protein RGA1 n=1 Tax=Elaeis guineensis var. tenera TaxID=51953 RepID=A0A6I9QG37_ELAGV|nr:putative disease resistance protein RGA1 [Elaeis guineensis]